MSRMMKQRDTNPQQHTAKRQWRAMLLRAFVCHVLVLIFLLLPFTPLRSFIPVASAHSAHAIPIRSDPPANAILHLPPTRVYLWFDDALVPTTSHLLVVNAQGQQVDRRDSAVSRTNTHELSVSLPHLVPGTYRVVWVAQSTDDGHVTNGSFLFSVAPSHGALPPGQGLSGQAGGQTGEAGQTFFDAPTLLQVLANWLLLLCLTLWVGGLLWETWILSPALPGNAVLVAAATVASQRFRRLIPLLLSGMLLADGVLVLSEGAQLSGSWVGAFTPSLWRAMLFGSQYGLFWGMRQGTALLALLLHSTAQRRGWSSWRPISEETRDTRRVSPEPPMLPFLDVQRTPFSWWRAFRQTLRNMVRGLPHMPTHLREGWRRRSWVGRSELVLGGLLLVAFAFSGHAAAVPPSELAYALSVDPLHLLGNVAWVGGLLYIGVVLLPALHRLTAMQRAWVCALGLPHFSALALLSALLLAATGSLNSTIHLSSWQQVFTTLYGNILVVKTEFFFLMALMSAFHAFTLRPRLAQALASLSLERLETEQTVPAPVRATAPRTVAVAARTQEQQPERDQEAEVMRLTARMETWLRREAMLGAGLLLCVALLSASAGTLVPALAH